MIHSNQLIITPYNELITNEYRDDIFLDVSIKYHLTLKKFKFLSKFSIIF